MAAESVLLSAEERIRLDVYSQNAGGGSTHAGASFQSLIRELVRCSMPQTKAGAAAEKAFDRVLFFCPEQEDDDWSVRPDNVLGERQPPCVEAIGYAMRSHGREGKSDGGGERAAGRLEELARQTACSQAVLLPQNGPHKPERVLQWEEKAAVQHLLLLLRDCGTPSGEEKDPGASKARIDTVATSSKSEPEIVMITAPKTSTNVLERVPDPAVDDSALARPEEMRMFHTATFNALAWPSDSAEDRARPKLAARPPARAAGLPHAGDLFGAVSHRWEHGGLYPRPPCLLSLRRTQSNFYPGGLTAYGGGRQGASTRCSRCLSSLALSLRTWTSSGAAAPSTRPPSCHGSCNPLHLSSRSMLGRTAACLPARQPPRAEAQRLHCVCSHAPSS